MPGIDRAALRALLTDRDKHLYLATYLPALESAVVQLLDALEATEAELTRVREETVQDCIQACINQETDDKQPPYRISPMGQYATRYAKAIRKHIATLQHTGKE